MNIFSLLSKLSVTLLFLVFFSSSFTFAQELKARTVDHDMGTSEIIGTPTRIVTLFQGATDTAVTLGVIPIGMVESWTNKPIYPYLRADLANSTNVGLETQPNLERIASLKPDLIVASQFRHEKIYRQLTAIAPVIVLKEIYDFKHTLSVMGDALNLQSQAQTLQKNWQNRVTEFKQTMQNQSQHTWPMKVSILNFRANQVRLYSTNSFQGSIVEELGFINSQANPNNDWIYKKLTSKEALPIINADTFFVLMRNNNPAVKENYQKWAQHPLWKRLEAVKNQQIYQVDEVTWSLSGGIKGANLVLDDMFKLFVTPKSGH